MTSPFLFFISLFFGFLCWAFKPYSRLNCLGSPLETSPAALLPWGTVEESPSPLFTLRRQEDVRGPRLEGPKIFSTSRSLASNSTQRYRSNGYFPPSWGHSLCGRFAKPWVFQPL
ncbi:hypothetical protein TNIN_153181 [Trichonephila inaurata madagascariensis]|uniref:Secreted protein n=1 Tax=Trichonephila inaurata madagascariensis TaxID=2747483 RepID=A0A8X6WZH9_9ARAC|nr:hypothetical protein TNIN_153181 [Trichonephila inaurata madagascariensis]